MRISGNLPSLRSSLALTFSSPGAPEQGRGGGLCATKLALAVVSASLFLTACASHPSSRPQLDAGEVALQNRQYDQALRDADAVIASNSLEDQAEANYLRGRALENRPKPDATAASGDLAAARTAYSTGLARNPSRQLELLLHGQLGNVAFYLDDYAAAHREWTLAYGGITDAQLKASLLYGIGVCQQRLGRFDDADQTFMKVQNLYPGTEYAQHARAHQGVRGFYVQVGAFSQGEDAIRAANAIRAVGSVPLMTVKNNLTLIRTPDVPSYAQAMELRSRLTAQYPDARVMP